MVLLLGSVGVDLISVMKSFVDNGYKPVTFFTDKPKEEFDPPLEYLEESQFKYLQSHGFFALVDDSDFHKYGLAVNDCKGDNVAIGTLNEYKDLCEIDDVAVVGVFITSDETQRGFDLMRAGISAFDVVSILQSDTEYFKDIKHEVDYIIELDKPNKEDIDKCIVCIIDMIKEEDE